MHLSLAVGTHTDQLGAMTDQLAQPPGSRRRNPRLGQPTHPQQVRQVASVPDIVLDPPVLKRLHTQRVRQVHLRPAGLQRIDRPVPPVGGLQDHLRALTRPRHRVRQTIEIIDDPHRLEDLTRLGGPHDHRPATMQINTHKLFPGIPFHQGPPST